MSNWVKDPDGIRTFMEQQIQNDRWQKNLEIDARLQDGISKGLKFSEFQQVSGCPKHLEGRYNQLTEQARRAEEMKHDRFLEGFQTDTGDYIPRQLR